MTHFTKSILKPGTYHSPDGIVEVTPERLRHWEAGVKKLQKAGYAIPSHFDHSNEIDMLEPIAMDVLERRRNRSAEATVGRLKDMKVAPDGQSAEIVLETLTPGAKQSVESNAVYVSPVIFPQWKDGAGNVYDDVITSFDLVDHPVDHSQSSFVPSQRMSVIHAIRMGVNSKPFRLGPPPMEEKDVPDDETESTDSEAPDQELPPEPEPEPEMGSGGDSQNLADVIQALQGMNIVLPPDTSPGNFLDRLHTALLTAAAHQGLDNGAGGDMGEQPAEAASPMIATMSVQQRATHNYAQNQYSAGIKSRLESLLKTGRCKPSEADQKRREITAVRLSLSPNGTPRKSSVEQWIESREVVPKGTFWSAEQKSESKAQRLSVSEPPTEWNATSALKEKLTPKQVQEGVDALLPRRSK